MRALRAVLAAIVFAFALLVLSAPGAGAQAGPPAPTTTVPPIPVTEGEDEHAAGEQIAVTGIAADHLVVYGILLIAVGAAMVAVGRRRPEVGPTVAFRW